MSTLGKRTLPLALALAAAPQLHAAGAAHKAPPPGAVTVAGPAAVSDAGNRLVLDLPAGWYAIVPRRGRGSTTLTNYDPRRIEDALPGRTSHAFAGSMVKVDLAAIDLPPGGSVAALVRERRAQIVNGALRADGGFDEGAAAGEPIPYTLAGRAGQAYAVEVGPITAVEIALPWSGDTALLATLLPADGDAVPAALAVLGGLRTTGGAASAPIQPAPPDLAAGAPPLRRLAAALAPAAIQAGECSGWTGSDPGANAPNTPIRLNLPFQWQTWWQSGGAGAFWGNLFHGNCYDDYYAIDFNRMNSSCNGYLDDTGQPVYAAADGTAHPHLGTSGYGNHVDVVHAGGAMTRYAHLQGVNVREGQGVTTQSVIGWVGSTGNSGGPHLHFGFYQNGVSRCNRAGGCPNGEAAKSPQTAKPSPMSTNLGDRALSDGGCFQSPP